MSRACTIVVSAHNAARAIERCLSSVAAQSRSDFECLIVNDGSTDNTKESATRFCDKDRRFRLINHLARTGTAAAFNTGLRAAKTEYICFLDAEDVLLPDSLDARLAPLAAIGDDDIIGSCCLTGSLEGCRSPSLVSAESGTSEIVCFHDVRQLLLQAEKVCALGGFDEGLAYAGNLEFLSRILQAGLRLVPVAEESVSFGKPGGGPEPVASASMFRHVRAGPAAARVDTTIAPATELLAGIGSELAFRQSLPVRQTTADLSNLVRFTSHLLGNDLTAQERERLLLSGAGEHLSLCPEQLRLKRPDLLPVFASMSAGETGSDPSGAGGASGLPSESASGSSLLSPDLERHEQPKVFFLPQKDYHVDAIAGARAVLREQGVDCHVVDLSSHCGDRGLRSKAAELGIPLVGLSPFMLGRHTPDLLVALNDWDGSVRAIFGAAQASGIKTVAIVEGIQDYWDADVNRDRGAYRTADVVLLPGVFDRRYFVDSSQEQYVCGIPRIARMSGKDAVPPPESVRVLINTNFSYGVLIEHRDAWLRAAAKACEDAGVDWAISKHPADRGKLFPERVTREDFETATLNSTVVVQRFASGVLESLALGRPTIYFNPHGEKADKFTEPLGAYPIATNQEHLTQLLRDANSLVDRYSSSWPAFLDRHCAAEDACAPDKSIVRILAELVQGAAPADPVVWTSNLRAVDKFSSALFDIKKIHEHIPPTYSRFRSEDRQADRLGFAQRLLLVNGDAVSTKAKLKINSKRDKLGSNDRSFAEKIEARWEMLLLQIDHTLEVFYHKTKNRPVFGPAIRKLSVVYDKLFKS